MGVLTIAKMPILFNSAVHKGRSDTRKLCVSFAQHIKKTNNKIRIKKRKKMGVLTIAKMTKLPILLYSAVDEGQSDTTKLCISFAQQV